MTDLWEKYSFDRSSFVVCRFIPDDEEFEREPKDACVELPDPLTFKPNLFFTTALNQTKVECTWDETPRDRLAITMKKYTEEDLMKSNDFKKLLASSESEGDDGEEGGGEEDGEKAESGGEEEESGSDEDGDAEEKRMRKYRSLLLGIEEKDREKTDKKMGLAFSWGDDDDKDFGADRSDTDSDDNLVSDKSKGFGILCFCFFLFLDDFFSKSIPEIGDSWSKTSIYIEFYKIIDNN